MERLAISGEIFSIIKILTVEYYNNADYCRMILEGIYDCLIVSSFSSALFYHFAFYLIVSEEIFSCISSSNTIYYVFLAWHINYLLYESYAMCDKIS